MPVAVLDVLDVHVVVKNCLGELVTQSGSACIYVILGQNWRRPTPSVGRNRLIHGLVGRCGFRGIQMDRHQSQQTQVSQIYHCWTMNSPAHATTVDYLI